MSLKSYLKTTLTGLLGALLGRSVVLLPREAVRDDMLLEVRTTYRVTGPQLVVELLDSAAGDLTATLFGYEGHFPTKHVWQAATRKFQGPGRLVLDLASGEVHLDDQLWGTIPLPLPTRRFCWQLDLRLADGRRQRRLTGHYVSRNGAPVNESYFEGDNYVDHEQQSAGDHAVICDLLQAHAAKPPLLEIGCATGGLLAELRNQGLPGVGVDISQWAVEKARQRLANDQVWQCDIEQQPLPPEVVARGPFRTLVMWMVFEHFRDPYQVLETLDTVVEPGSLLVLGTTNADSLSHFLHDGQWEGYFDWTHAGVDKVSVPSLQERLPKLGWRIDYLRTHLFWDANADPTSATMRDWYAADSRFRQLLAERDLGDLITCVATKL